MYTVRQLGFKHFEVANFTDYSEPVAVYSIRDSRCSCPARKPCKHMNVLKMFNSLDSGAWCFEICDNGVIKPYSIAMMEIEEK